MPFNVVKLTCDPPQPAAGQNFYLTAELQQKSSVDTAVTLEKQRIVLGNGGAPELRPTGPDYCDLDPKPITVKKGHKRATSDPIQVRKDAKAEPGEGQSRFPSRRCLRRLARMRPRFPGETSAPCWP